uniref:Uncharacterized LOC100177663 n=1 Tax=Ciona intestinalis TaxID=7719 RepID=F6ZNG6_CIOIN|nr:uncharacterized protein LOC100177663 isoform X1 [Ciona intestinalis]|eukprot:XP_002130336.1 uncharacterized protein LOC100177663 isoform X1 [Ciona intestinalis]
MARKNVAKTSRFKRSEDVSVRDDKKQMKQPIGGRDVLYGIAILSRIYYSLYWANGDVTEFGVTPSSWMALSTLAIMAVPGVSAFVVANARPHHVYKVLFWNFITCVVLATLWLFVIFVEATFLSQSAYENDSTPPMKLGLYPQYSLISSATFGITLFLASSRYSP